MLYGMSLQTPEPTTHVSIAINNTHACVEPSLIADVSLDRALSLLVWLGDAAPSPLCVAAVS